MGGIGTWHIGNKHQNLFTAAIPIASDTRVDHSALRIHSRDDEILPIAPVRDHVKRLKAAGARIEYSRRTALSSVV
jgi:predicted peptidase